MSYFDQRENTSVNASYGRLITTMMADILAIQNLYGAPGATSVTGGNTVWGVNSNLSGYLGDYFNLLSGGNGNSNFRGNQFVAMTIYDVGGRDLLNLTTSTTDDRIDLREESFSDVGGRIGALGIARGTVIENAFAGSGDDEITGNGVRNHIRGNGGNDTIFGGGGNDLIEGGSGNDRLLGNIGADVVRGGDGNDQIFGGAGSDRLFGNQGADIIRGGQGNDRIIGGTGNDQLFGEGGADVVRGGQGNDRINGGASNDRLFGDGGADVVRGGLGNDTIKGGGGNDTLFGENGADVFIFGNRHGNDVIRDFEVSRVGEVIDLRAIASITNMDQLNAAMENTADGVLITTGAESSILLTGLTAWQLSVNDFIFV
jgi:serralysin